MMDNGNQNMGNNNIGNVNNVNIGVGGGNNIGQNQNYPTIEF